MFPVFSFTCWSNSLCGCVYTEKHQTVDSVVSGKDGQGFCHGAVMSVTAPGKKNTHKQKPADHSEKRMPPQQAEDSSVIQQESSFNQGIPDRYRPMAVVAPAS